MRLWFLLLAFALVAPAGLASRVEAACTVGKIAELPVTMDGPVPLVRAKVNGVEALFVFDSGAFWSSLTPASAARFGLQRGSLPDGLQVHGAGGVADVSMANVQDFVFHNTPYHHLDFLVSEHGASGNAAGVIGQNLLGSTDVEYDLANGVIRLMHADGCDRALLAYWIKPPQAYSVIDIDRTDPARASISGSATLNGKKIRVVFDTGAYRSILSLRAAAWAGVKPTDPGVTTAGYSYGLAQRSYAENWIAPFASFKLGDEEIKNTRLRIGDLKLDDVDMLVGADFFLSHRIYVAKSQHKLYLTYNGGPVFRLDAAPQVAPGIVPPDAASAGATSADTPADAAGFNRRAHAFAARKDYADAIADMTRAVALEPASPSYVYERGLMRSHTGQLDAAMADFDQALKLNPNYVRALLLRARVELARKNMASALLDLQAADRAAAHDPDARLLIAETYEQAGMSVESIAQYDQWIAAHPKDDRLGQALNGRCWIRAVWNLDLPLALADCNAALKLSPGDPTFLGSRGLVRLRMGDFDRAISDYDGALKLGTDSPWALYGRGLARVHTGKKTEGDADLQAVAARWPHFAEEAKARGLTP